MSVGEVEDKFLLRVRELREHGRVSSCISVLRVGSNCGRGRALHWIELELVVSMQKFCSRVGKALHRSFCSWSLVNVTRVQ